jgi:selenocysteine lyase/cysteine desulfurase
MSNFSIDAVRSQFPALALNDDGKRRIYFDNPAGTQVPQQVIERATKAMIEQNANLGGFFVTPARHSNWSIRCALLLPSSTMRHRHRKSCSAPT